MCACGRASLHTLLLVALCLATSAGCARRRDATAQPEPPPREFASDIPVEIENRHWRDLTIYVVRQGQRSRLGSVRAASAATLVIPRRHMLGYRGEIRLLADPLGSNTVLQSETIVVLPGQIIMWTLAPDLRRSSIALR